MLTSRDLKKVELSCIFTPRGCQDDVIRRHGDFIQCKFDVTILCKDIYLGKVTEGY